MDGSILLGLKKRQFCQNYRDLAHFKDRLHTLASNADIYNVVKIFGKLIWFYKVLFVPSVGLLRSVAAIAQPALIV